jgi:hypothetical protein
MDDGRNVIVGEAEQSFSLPTSISIYLLATIMQSLSLSDISSSISSSSSSSISGVVAFVVRLFFAFLFDASV